MSSPTTARSFDRPGTPIPIHDAVVGVSIDRARLMDLVVDAVGRFA